jgi:hypothetical protein
MRCSWFWAIVFLLALAPVAPAQEPVPACVPPEVILHEIDQITPVVRQVKLNEQQAARVLAWYNKVPPPSDDHFNTIILIQTTRGLALLLGNDDLICMVAPTTRGQVQGLLDAIAGGEGT